MDTEVQNNQDQKTAIAIWAITPNGLYLGLQLRKQIQGAALFLSQRIFADTDCLTDIFWFESLPNEIAAQFHRFSGHVFIFSTGIAVRLIAPLLKSKTRDPAVVVTDDNAGHVISLLSGHIGGANELTEKVAGILDADPVITTATDVNQLPAIDMIAKDLDLFIETPQTIKHINMAILKGNPIALMDPFNIIARRLINQNLLPWPPTEDGMAGILCSPKTVDVPRETFILRPRVLCVGIGCNRGTPYEDIRQFLLKILSEHHLSLHSIHGFGTTDVKKDETGLSLLAREMKINLTYYSREQLNSVKTIKNPSRVVQKHLGVKSVCEAAAILTANNGELIVPKKKNKDVTIAVAIRQ